MRNRNAILLGIVGLTACVGAAAPAERRAWELLLALRFDEAKAVASASTDRESKLAGAIALQNALPVTSGKLAAAKLQLESLCTESSTDAIGVAATYQLARLAQFHPDAPDPDRAAELYEACIASDPKHPLAQTALVKLALLKIYTADDVSRRRVFDTFAQRGESLTEPAARRDIHQSLATAAQRFGFGPAVALQHLRAFDESAITKRKTQADLLVRRGELALAIGDRPAAVLAYERFLQTFPSDPRAYFVSERLAELKSAATATRPAP